MLSAELRRKAESLVERYPVGRSALLPLLHLVQSQDGYISADGVAECAELLGLTKAEVGAVATFYTMYKRQPLGRHLVSVCTNFSCKVRGAQEVYDRLEHVLGVGHNGTTDDGALTLEHAECLGNCEGAPVVTVDYFNYECVTPDQAEELVMRLRAGEVPPPTRGIPSSGIREVSHRLAGLGPAAGAAGEGHDAVDASGSSDGDGEQATTVVGAAEQPDSTKTGMPDNTPLHAGTDLGAAQEGPSSAQREDSEREATEQIAEAGMDADAVAAQTEYSAREFPNAQRDAEQGFPANDPRKEDLEEPAPQDNERMRGEEPAGGEPDGSAGSPAAGGQTPVGFPGGEPGASSGGRGTSQARGEPPDRSPTDQDAEDGERGDG